MKQIIHIFKKDVRHHWAEILLCQVALALYCWHEVVSWTDRTFVLYGVATLIRFLLPLSWGFLIFRVVQSESLVGDRQFWVTRPYQWKALLAEKVGFVLTVINLPLLVAGAVLLVLAGFAPAPHAIGMVWMQVLLIQTPLLPLFALAAVSRNLATGLMALLAVVLYVAGLSVLGTIFYGSTFPAHDFGWLHGAIIAAATLVAIGLQYACRKTLQSRAWLVGGAAAIVVLSLASHYLVHGEDRYPAPPAARQPALKVEFDPVKVAPAKAPAPDEGLGIVIPMVLSGVPRGSLANPFELQLSLEAPDGFRWKSSWLGYYGLWGPGDNRWQPMFSIDRKTYDRLKAVPVKAHVLVTLNVFHDHAPRPLSFGEGEIGVSGVGRCRLVQLAYNRGSAVQCHSPLLRPPPVIVRADPETSTCPTEEKPKSSEVYHYAWMAGGNSKLAEYGVSPVESFQFIFEQMRICPGTPLLVSFPDLTERTRAEFDVEGIKLEDYRYDWSRVIYGPQPPTLAK